MSLFRHYWPGVDVAGVSIKMFWLMLSRLQDIDERQMPSAMDHRTFVDRAAARRREE